MGSFPNVIYLEPGDEKTAQSAKIGNLPLGALGIDSFGRVFRHTKAGTAALLPGQLAVQGSTVPDHGAGTADQMVANSAAVGSRTITVTAPGTTAITKDFYTDGVAFVRDDTGEGLTYRVKSNNSAATGSTCIITLYENDKLTTALGASATVGLRINPFSTVITRATGSASVGPPVGVAVAAVSAGFYCWLLQNGEGAGLVTATALVIGQPVVPSTAVAGAFAPVVASTTNTIQDMDIIGHVSVVSGSTEYALIKFKVG